MTSRRTALLTCLGSAADGGMQTSPALDSVISSLRACPQFLACDACQSGASVVTQPACTQDGGDDGDVRGPWHGVSSSGAQSPQRASDPAQRQRPADLISQEDMRGLSIEVMRFKGDPLSNDVQGQCFTH